MILSTTHLHRARYIGTNPAHIGHTAYARKTSDPKVILVQTDDMQHEYAYRWHEVSTDEWEVEVNV